MGTQTQAQLQLSFEQYRIITEELGKEARQKAAQTELSKETPLLSLATRRLAP